MERVLEVLLDGQRRVGLLHENDDVWRFDYDPAWARDPQGFDLAPGLPRFTLSVSAARGPRHARAGMPVVLVSAMPQHIRRTRLRLERPRVPAAGGD